MKVIGGVLLVAGFASGMVWMWESVVKDELYRVTQQTAGENARAWLAREWALSGHNDEPFLTPEPDSAGVFAALIIPNEGGPLVRAIAGGAEQTTLNSSSLGVWHYPTTALPSNPGNFAIAAHRDGYGASFRDIDSLETGDSVFIEVVSGWIEYRVRASEVVEPTDSRVLLAAPGRQNAPAPQRVLTLTTCHPRYSTSQRLVVYADFFAWHPRDRGAPGESGLGE